MIAPNVKRFLVLVVLVGSVFSLLSAESLAQLTYPPYGALRGRMVDRNGPFHVTRYRWGNGVTPQGAAMITDLGQTFAPMIPLLVTGGVGRGADDGTGDGQSRSVGARSLVEFTAPADYVEEQRRANNLLERTAALVEFWRGRSAPRESAQRPRTSGGMMTFSSDTAAEQILGRATDNVLHGGLAIPAVIGIEHEMRSSVLDAGRTDPCRQASEAGAC